jgi:hypothetical protein
MNLRSVLRRVSRLETATPAAARYSIPKGSGMAGVRAAVAAAKADREARGEAKQEAPLGMPQSPFHALRSDILAERARREALGAAAYADCLAIYNETEEQSTCAAPMTTNPETSSE